MEVIKEEHIANDRVLKILKREGTIVPKIEEFHPYPMLYPQLNLNPLVFSWFTNSLPYYYPIQKININPLNRFYTFEQPLKSSCFESQDLLKDQKPQVNQASSTQSVKIEESIEIKTSSVVKRRKKAVRVSACKNYIGLLCAGFARTLLTAGNGSEVLNHIKELLCQRRDNFESLHKFKEEELMDSFKQYIYKTMCGKKVKKSNRERDFKTRNTEELDSLLIVKEGDDEITCLNKEVLKEMVHYFFTSDCFDQWLSKGMMSESNRFFFQNNKEEIKKKFQNPASYKPRFYHGSN